MNILNANTLTRALGNGISLGIVQEGVGSEKGKHAVMAGAYMGGASLVTDALGGVNPLSNQAYWGPSAKPFSDAVFYSLISAMAQKKDRQADDIFRNFLYAFGSSFIVSTVAYPLQAMVPAPAAGPSSVLASPGAPAAAVNQPVSRTFATSSY